MLEVEVELYYTASSPGSNDRLHVLLTEDHIVGWQSNYGAGGSNPAYDHRHVLRTYLTPLAGVEIPVAAQGETFTTTWTYDLQGRLTKLAYPSGLSVQYLYDSYGRVTTVQAYLSGAWQTVASGVLYQPATNRPYAWLFGNGLARMATLDTDARVARLTQSLQVD